MNINTGEKNLLKLIQQNNYTLDIWTELVKVFQCLEGKNTQCNHVDVTEHCVYIFPQQNMRAKFLWLFYEKKYVGHLAKSCIRLVLVLLF